MGDFEKMIAGFCGVVICLTMFFLTVNHGFQWYLAVLILIALAVCAVFGGIQ